RQVPAVTPVRPAPLAAARPASPSPRRAISHAPVSCVSPAAARPASLSARRSPPWPNAPRRRRRQRVVRPVMLRVAPLQVLLHLEVRGPPEALQVARHLDRPARRREQAQREGHPPPGDAGRPRPPEDLL